MSLPLNEVIDKLKQIDEITLLELLNLNSEDIVDRWEDVIENDQDRLEYELQQFFDEPEEEV